MKIAVVGGGISGLGAAWLLRKAHDITLFEAADYMGGHTHTVDVEVDAVQCAVDTGFLVFNHRTYPNLTALFNILDIRTVASDMSLAISLTNPDLEWAGSSLSTLFAQKRNLHRPGFWRMLQDALRFNRNTQSSSLPDISLGAYLTTENYSEEFRHWYLLPMAAAIWSCPTQAVLEYPLTTFVRFCRNHGLLQIFDRPQWQTVAGGGRQYVDRIVSQLADVRLSAPVLAVQREENGVCLTLTGNLQERFDAVILACHSDEALGILGQHASNSERRILEALRYQPNRAVLHTDTRLLPRDEKVWSAWNYMSSEARAEQQSVSVSYLINRLQPLPVSTPVILSLNPHVAPDAQKVLGEYDYQHPLFDQAAIAAQGQLSAIQGVDRVWFCGAWSGYGFHEDGLTSAVKIAAQLGCPAPWHRASHDMARSA